MTAIELTAVLQEITVQVANIMSFGLGGLCAMAFVMAAGQRWH